MQTDTERKLQQPADKLRVDKTRFLPQGRKILGYSFKAALLIYYRRSSFRQRATYSWWVVHSGVEVLIGRLCPLQGCCLILSNLEEMHQELCDLKFSNQPTKLPLMYSMAFWVSMPDQSSSM